jgi:putative sigma-54 modulation protein
MDIIIQSLGFKASDSLEDHVREKLNKLTPNDHIVRANVILYQGPQKATPNDYCEIRLEVPGNDHFVKEHSPDFEQAIDQCVNKLQTMLRKAKEKAVDRWHGRVNEAGIEISE